VRPLSAPIPDPAPAPLPAPLPVPSPITQPTPSPAAGPHWPLLLGLGATLVATGSAMYLGLPWEGSARSPRAPDPLWYLATRDWADAWHALASVYLPAGFGLALGLAARLPWWRVAALGLASLLAYNAAAGLLHLIPTKLVDFAVAGAAGALVMLLAMALARWRRPPLRAVAVVAGAGAAGGLGWTLFADTITPFWLGVPLAYLTWQLPVGLTLAGATDPRSATGTTSVPWRLLTVLAGIVILHSAAAAWRRSTLVPVRPGVFVYNPVDSQPYVWVPPGQFEMGCSPGDASCDGDERPVRTVRFTHGFWLGQYEVTVSSWRQIYRAMPPPPVWRERALNAEWADGGMPMVQVTWAEARDYCSAVDGRLPTEAEWEYAARAGTTGQRHGELADVAWYADNAGVDPAFRSQGLPNDAYENAVATNRSTMQRVGTRRPNAWRLYDMLGNVAEWTEDDYRPTYAGSGQTDPQPYRSGTPNAPKVVRGGSWYNRPSVVRVSYRGRAEPARRNIVTGFRCVWNKPPA
jgi:formylglycine-generating enzyme required for sulfatase activity